jgi:farnesyl-diphosphate farnesyltransferase
MPPTPAPAPAPGFLPLLRGVSRSFYLSIRLLPPALRQPVGLAYLLARATDSIADTAELPAAERAGLLQVLAAAIDGDPAATAALPALAGRFAPLQVEGDEQRLIRALPQCVDALQATDSADRADIRQVLRHITRGQALDVERFAAAGPCRALDSAEQLAEYTYLVAGSVGEFWTDLCQRHLPAFASLPAARMRELGRSFGSGLQLVNILRDAGEDLAAGRCYLPADELATIGVAPAEAAQHPQRLLPVWREWMRKAEANLADGMRYAEAVENRRVRAACALPALLGARTLALLREAGPEALTHKVKVPRAEVRALLLRMALTWAARAPLRAQFDRYQSGAARSQWDNPAR